MAVVVSADNDKPDFVDSGKTVQIIGEDSCSFEVENGALYNDTIQRYVVEYKIGMNIISNGHLNKPSQRFFIKETGENTEKYYITTSNRESIDYYLAVYDDATSGSGIKLRDDGGTGSQWILEKGDDGKYLIVSAVNESLAIGISNEWNESGNKSLQLVQKNSAERFSIEDAVEKADAAYVAQISDGNGNSFDVEGGNKYENGISIISYTTGVKETQKFLICETEDNSGEYFIETYKAHFYLNACGGAKNGAFIKLWDGGDDNSKWILEKGDDGKWLIVSAADKTLAISISNQKTDKGNKQFCLVPKGSAMRFSIEEPMKPIRKYINVNYYSYRIYDGINSFDVEDGNYNNGTNIILFKSAYNDNQRISFTEVEKDSRVYTIEPFGAPADKRPCYLNAFGGATNGAPIKLWGECDDNSKWIIEEGADGKCLIVSAANESLAIGISNQKSEKGNTTLCLVPKESATRFVISDDFGNIPSGTTLSTGNWWIIVVGAVVIVGGIVTIIVFNKKKKKKTK